MEHNLAKVESPESERGAFSGSPFLTLAQLKDFLSGFSPDTVRNYVYPVYDSVEVKSYHVSKESGPELEAELRQQGADLTVERLISVTPFGKGELQDYNDEMDLFSREPKFIYQVYVYNDRDKLMERERFVSLEEAKNWITQQSSLFTYHLSRDLEEEPVVLGVSYRQGYTAITHTPGESLSLYEVC